MSNLHERLTRAVERRPELIPADVEPFIENAADVQIEPPQQRLKPSEPQAEPASIDWPERAAPEAFYGLAGDFVRIVSPQTEGDPHALLGQFLVFFGNVIGRESFFRVGADRHTANTNLVIVGRTSSGRKGVSLSETRRPFQMADPTWADTRSQSGLSSGEGLIWNVRDPIERKDPVKEHGSVVRYETVIADHGIEDKRLLVTETEFSNTLKVAEREGNTLTGVIRQAWDTGSLRLLTKTNPAQASGTHISILGHITQDELLRLMSTTEMANGFANRFLWLSAKRSRILPHGGNLEDADLVPLVERLKRAIEYGRRGGEVRRDSQASKTWETVYEDLSSGKPGLLGAILSRSTAQVVRLSMNYALLDESLTVREEHLHAALALWDYAEASTRYIFGDAIGDPIADTILNALRVSLDGLTRTEISNLFSRNRDKQGIDHSLAALARQDLARCIREETGGRPTEKWVAVTVGQNGNRR